MRLPDPPDDMDPKTRAWAEDLLAALQPLVAGLQRQQDVRWPLLVPRVTVTQLTAASPKEYRPSTLYGARLLMTTGAHSHDTLVVGTGTQWVRIDNGGTVS